MWWIVGLIAGAIWFFGGLVYIRFWGKRTVEFVAEMLLHPDTRPLYNDDILMLSVFVGLFWPAWPVAYFALKTAFIVYFIGLMGFAVVYLAFVGAKHTVKFLLRFVRLQD